MFDPDALDMGETTNARQDYEAAFVLSLTLAAAIHEATGIVDDDIVRGAYVYAIGPTTEPLAEVTQ